MRLKKYATCVKELEDCGLTRRQIAKLIGIDEAVISRRMYDGRTEGRRKSKPTTESLIVINILAEVFKQGFVESKEMSFDDKGWLHRKIQEANMHFTQRTIDE